MVLIARLTFLLTLISSTIYANDIAGKWKTVDDKTGFSRADVEIFKNTNGTYSGKIINIRPLPNKPLVEKCINCKGPQKNANFVGLEIINGFIQNPERSNEYLNGKILDPLSGKTYRGKINLNSKNTKLNLRGYIGVSALGRSATWIRIE